MLCAAASIRELGRGRGDERVGGREVRMSEKEGRRGGVSRREEGM